MHRTLFFEQIVNNLFFKLGLRSYHTISSKSLHSAYLLLTLRLQLISLSASAARRGEKLAMATGKRVQKSLKLAQLLCGKL